MTWDCDVVLPCRDEAAALPGVLASMPAGFRALVVDNGSRDRTATVAERYGARVVTEPRPGYGSAVHAGVASATATHVAVADGDGSFDLSELPRLLRPVLAGMATMAVGRRRPVARQVWPWHARVGSALVAGRLRARTSLDVHDLAPVRACRRTDLLDLDVQDRAFGYPVELLVRAASRGWSVVEIDVPYLPRAPGTRSKVSGSALGSLRAVRDFVRVLS